MIRKYQNWCPVMAEKEGFEPSIPFWGIHDFQSCALGQLRDFSIVRFLSVSLDILQYLKRFVKYFFSFYHGKSLCLWYNKFNDSSLFLLCVCYNRKREQARWEMLMPWKSSRISRRYFCDRSGLKYIGTGGGSCRIAAQF